MYRIRNRLSGWGGSTIRFAVSPHEAEQVREQLVDELARAQYLRRGNDAVVHRTGGRHATGGAFDWHQSIWNSAAKYDGETDFRLMPWSELINRLQEGIEVTEVHESVLAE